MATTITIDDQSTTLNLNDGVNYRVRDGGYAPSISNLRNTPFGYGSYEEVVDTITLDVLGSTTAVALSNLATLISFLDRSHRWYRGDRESCIGISYKPDGAAVTGTLRSMILGRADTTPLVTVSPEFNAVTYLYEIRNVTLSFKRFAHWLWSPGGTDAQAASGVNFSTAQQFVFPTSVKYGYMDLMLTVTGSAATATIPASMLITSRGTGNIAVIDMYPTSITNWTSQADATNNPEGSGVIRYAPVATTESFSATAGVTLSTVPRKIGFVAMVRNNNVGITWQTRVKFTYRGRDYYTPKTVISLSTTTPQPVFLGSISNSDGFLFSGALSLGIAASSIAGGPSIDIDCVVAVGMDDEFTTVLAIDSSGSIALTGDPLLVQHQLNSKPNVRVGYNNNLVSYRGDPLIRQTGTTFGYVWLCGGTGTQWRLTSTALRTYNITGSRTRAYLIPE